MAVMVMVNTTPGTAPSCALEKESCKPGGDRHRQQQCGTAHKGPHDLFRKKLAVNRHPERVIALGMEKEQQWK